MISVHEFGVEKVHSTRGEIWSPVFSISSDHFWELQFTMQSPETSKFCSLYLYKSAKYWKHNSNRNLPYATIFIKNPVSGAFISKRRLSAEALSKCQVGTGWGYKEFCLTSLLPNYIMCGVYFGEIKFESSNIEIPKSLVSIWIDSFKNKATCDVEFSVNGEKYFASSQILSQRSEYFRSMFTSSWSESRIIKAKELKQEFYSNEPSPCSGMSKNNSCNGFFIEVTDFHHETFLQMLGFLYTNGVVFAKNPDSPNNPLMIFALADKYLIKELRDLAKQEILQNLDFSNASGVLFQIGSKWPDLKEPVMDFFIENFSKIRETKEFKEITTEPEKFPDSSAMLAELLLKLVPKVK
ncbi:hypothetical protein G9A89_010024 [Geosiphon pyriformis]|nr:hypothetical protein G9A89_010024 [Geosiphon pyriformis]